MNLESYCKEMWRILKPGGLLVASTDCRQTPMQLGPTFLRRSHPCVYREGGSERASSRQTKQFRHDWTDRPLLYRELGRDSCRLHLLSSLCKNRREEHKGQLPMVVFAIWAITQAS